MLYKAENVEEATKPERLKKIEQTFAEKLYQIVSRGLFVSHKLSFALDIAVTLEQAKGRLTSKQFELFMACCARNLEQYSKGIKIPAENTFKDLNVQQQQWENINILFTT